MTGTPRRICTVRPCLHAEESQLIIGAGNAGLDRILLADFENKSRISSTVSGRRFSTVTTFGDPEAPSSPSGVGVGA